MRLIMALMAAQRIMASEVAGWRSKSSEATVGGEPGNGPFDAPTAGEDGDAVLVGGPSYDAQDRGGPVDEFVGEATVGENEPNRADQVRRRQGI
jgi:hypothetical protein